MAKKIIIKTAILIFATFLALTAIPGCSSKNNEAVKINIATAAAGGVWSPLGNALGQVITKNVKGASASSQETGGAVENLKLMAAGKVQIIFAYDYHVAKINNGGMPDVASQPLPMRIIMGLYEQPLHIITTAIGGISGLNDLKGKRISTGLAGSGTEEQAGYLLGALGIDPGKDIIQKKLNLEDSAAGLKSGSIDAFFWSGAVPSESSSADPLSGLASDPNFKIVILPVDSGTADKVMQQRPGVFHPTAIKAGEYQGMASDVQTLAVTAVLAVMDNFPGDILKEIVNAVFENKNEALAKAWKGAQSLTPEKSQAILAPQTRKYIHPAALEALAGRETVYQLSNYASLSKGGFSGFETAGQLMAQSDFGIGTFDGIAGEMILLDGKMYQVLGLQDIASPREDIMIPYMTATRFDADISKNETSFENLEALKKELDSLIIHKDSFYAIRMEGTFKKIKVRTVLKQEEPYPSLEEVIKKQLTGEFENIQGTLVGFWTPEYAGTIIPAGYHFHFISNDYKTGGHLLEFESLKASAALDETRAFGMILAPAGSQ
jgi:alpha-acetolactate decarboxylase